MEDDWIIVPNENEENSNLFNLSNDLKHTFNILIIGKRSSGKTELVKHILSSVIGKIKNRYLFSKFPEQYENMKPFFVDKSDLNNILRESVAHYNERYYNKTRDRSRLICFDDYSNDKKFFKDESVKSIYMNGWNLSISTIFTCQSILEIPPQVREHFTHLFVFKESNSNRIRPITKNFDKEKKKEFNGMMNSMKPYDVLVVDVIKNNKLTMLKPDIF